MKRLLLLGASALALTACDTVSSTEALDGDGIGVAAAGYTPVYYDEESEPGNDVFVYDDTPGGGLVGFMGFSDGVVRPVRVRIAEDGSSAYLSINGGAEIAFDTQEFEGWSGPAGFFSPTVSGYYENYVSYSNLSDDSSAAGYYGQQTAPADLLTGLVTFSASGEMSGDGVFSEFGLVLNMDFANSSILGNINGFFSDQATEFGGSYSGEVTGEMVGSFFAMSSDVAGEDLSGNLGFLGAFYDYGAYIGGGAAGTINGKTLGGDFAGSEGGFDPMF